MSPDYGTPEYESRWVREKLKLPPDAKTGDVQGMLHVWDASQHGMTAYIAAYKCNDKQGEIARLAAKVRELELAAMEYYDWKTAIEGFPNLPVMREQMEELAAGKHRLHRLTNDQKETRPH